MDWANKPGEVIQMIFCMAFIYAVIYGLVSTDFGTYRIQN
jgi:hypothetical protein